MNNMEYVKNVVDKFKEKYKKDKRTIIIIAICCSVLVLGIGLGIGFGLGFSKGSSSVKNDSQKYFDPFLNIVRSRDDLLSNGMENGRVSVHEENGKLFADISQGRTFNLAPPEYTFTTGNGITFAAGGSSPRPSIKKGASAIPEFFVDAFKDIEEIYLGTNYFYTVVYGNIGYVKLLNDGMIWGGYKYDTNSKEVVLHEALKDHGPLKFGEILENGSALIDLAIVNEYQKALIEYTNADERIKEATQPEDADYDALDAAKARLKNVDNSENKQAREDATLTWKIFNNNGQAAVWSKKIAGSISELPYNPATTGTDPITRNWDNFLTDVKNYPQVDNAGKFDTTNLKCGMHDSIKGFVLAKLYDDNGKQACLLPEQLQNENNKALINQKVKVSLGDLNYKLKSFQGGIVEYPLLRNFRARPNGKVILPGMMPIEVIPKTHTFVLPKDLKVELHKAS